MTKLSTLFLAALTLFSIPAYCFVNIESLRQSDEMGLLGSLALKLNGAAGNTEKNSTSVGWNNIYRNQKNEYIFLVNYFYSEVSSEKNTNRGQAHARYSKNLTQRHAIESFTQIEFDDFKALRYRGLLGLGLRYRPLKKSRIRLALGAGAFYENEEFDEGVKFILYRANLYASVDLKISKTAELTFINYLQPAFQNIENFRYRSTLSLNLEIYGNLSMSTDLRYIFDSNIEDPLQKGDFVYMTGLTLEY